MDKDYKERLDKLKEEDVTKETTAKSLVSTGEDVFKILGEMSDLSEHVKNSHDKDNEEDKSEDKTKKKSKRRTVNSMQIKGVRFRVVEYDSSYVGDLSKTTDIYHAQKLGMKLRSLEVDLQNGVLTMESGMFQSSEGKVKLNQKMSPIHMLKGLVRKMNDETFFRPEFGGTGTVRLESDFKFIQLIHVPERTRLVLEKGIYLASAGEWEYTTAKNFNAGMIFFSEKSILQTELKGAGLVALELPVHPTELIKHIVTEDRPFKVSGEYVLYWTGNLTRKINPAKKILGNLASGRGVFEEYTGEGFVYTAPTLGYFNKIAEGLEGVNSGNTDPIQDDTDTGKRSNNTLKDLLGMRTGTSKLIVGGLVLLVLFIVIKVIF